MKVVHLLSGDRWAGAEVATYHLLRALRERPGLRVEALLLNPGQLAGRLEAAGVRVAIESERAHSFPALAHRVRRRLADADLVHAHRYKENVIACLSGRPWLATQHGAGEPFRGFARMRMGLYRRLETLALRRSARAVIAVSTELARELERRVGAKRVHLVPNGIPDPAPRLLPRPWSERSLRVGTLGRLDPVKRIELAIEAVAPLAGVELEIVGEGPQRVALEHRIARRGLCERVHLVGFDPDPLPRLASWRALLVPSRHEGSPIAVIEALALGTPVVAAEAPGLRSMLADGAGCVVPEPTPQAWSTALAALLFDTDRGRSLAAAGRARFEREYRIERTAAAVAALYRELAAGG